MDFSSWSFTHCPKTTRTLEPSNSPRVVFNAPGVLSAPVGRHRVKEDLMRKDMSELTPRQRSQISALKRMPDDQIDTSDIPEVLNWSNATRGTFYRPGQKHLGRAIGSTTDTSEKGLERLICEALTGAACDPAEGGTVRERPAGYAAGWICGDPRDYDRAYCVDLAQLAAFLHDTQPNAAESLDLGQDSPTRRRFLARLQGEVTKRGTMMCFVEA